MAGLNEFVQEITNKGRVRTMVRNPMAQFIDPNSKREFMGAKMFPRENRMTNEYTEAGIQIRILPARDNSPFSPPILQTAFAKGDASVRLGHFDTGSQLTGRDYESMMNYFKLSGEAVGQQMFLRWLDQVTAGSLAVKSEIQNWDLIVNGQVTVAIDNTTYTASYGAPPANRFNATVDWQDNALDPFVDILTAWNLLWDLGFDVAHNITSNKVAGVLAGNTKVKERAGYLAVKSGTVSPVFGLGADPLALVNQVFGKGGEAGGREIPMLETYDLNYEIIKAEADTSAQPSLSKLRKYFLDRNCFVVVGKTNMQRPILTEDSILGYLDNTLGYTGVGRVPGYEEQGIISKVNILPNTEKLTGVKAEAYAQMSPVANARSMEAIIVIKNINIS